MNGPGTETGIRIGTCSWKYESWRGLVYSEAPANYLEEYARRYDTVEVDQWFWSLYGPDKVSLPRPDVVREYAASVPDDFRFAVKMPNSLTMTHFHPTSPKGYDAASQARKTNPLVPNPHFLSQDLLSRTLECLEPMRGKLGPLMFQFGYLNRQKMASQDEFLDKLGAFVGQLPSGYTWGVESRNPNHLNDRHFGLLRDRGLAHVFLQGYYMPPISEIYGRFAGRLADNVVIRLHGPDREGIEERTGKDWSKILEPRDADLDALTGILKDLRARRRTAWLMVNNHFEGCAPQTIERIRERLGSR